MESGTPGGGGGSAGQEPKEKGVATREMDRTWPVTGSGGCGRGQFSDLRKPEGGPSLGAEEELPCSPQGHWVERCPRHSPGRRLPGSLPSLPVSSCRSSV